MTYQKRIITGVVCVALSLSFMGCAKLNPKTEGQIFSALSAKKEDFTKCYEKALEDDREAKGNMKLALKFDPKSTKPSSTAVAKSTIKDEKMQKCVSKAADSIRIEEAPGVYVEGYYDVNFQYK